jgi:hypothetical protein
MKLAFFFRLEFRLEVVSGVHLKELEMIKFSFADHFEADTAEQCLAWLRIFHTIPIIKFLEYAQGHILMRMACSFLD